MSSWGEFPLLWETVVFALKVFVDWLRPRTYVLLYSSQLIVSSDHI